MAAVPGHGSDVPNPRYDVPRHLFVGVEHPFKTVNPAMAIENLGGEGKVSKLVEARESDNFELQLQVHRGRRDLNSLMSGNTAARSLVCQVTIPKLIGRKRKRRDDRPDGEIEPHGLSEQQTITKALANHGTQCDFRVLGEYKRVHKFRTMPDFVYSMHRNGFMQKFNSTIGTLDSEIIKQFKLDENTEFEKGSDLIPPPLFSQQTIPFNYFYRQNINVKVVVGDDGQATTWNEGLAPRSLTPRVQIDIEQVPTGPPSNVLPLTSVPQGHRDLVKTLQDLFAERPIWTRRAVKYELRNHKLASSLKWSFQYIGYEFKTGPWATTIIRYGLDPRKDPAMRMYQSISIQIDPPKRGSSTYRTKRHDRDMREPHQKPETADENGVAGYMFTGKTLINDGKVWQVCDMVDPLLTAILSTKDLRSECDLNSDGWFQNGTWAKARMIFRYKARSIISENNVWTEEDFIQASKMPDSFNPANRSLPIDTTGWNKRSLLLAYHIKQTAAEMNRDRGHSTAEDISAAVIEELRQHDNEDPDPAETDKTFEELLAEEGGVLDDGDEPEELEGEDEDDEDGDAGNED